VKDKISMIIFVLLLGVVLTSALVAVDYYTASRIERNKLNKIKASVLKTLDISYSDENMEKIFSENINENSVGGFKFYNSREGCVAFEFAGSGLWGPITGIIALFPDMETIKGITVVHIEETPGLGSRIAEKIYLDKFKGKKLLPEIRIQPSGKSNGDNEVDSLTGATSSSNAFGKILNSEFKRFKQF